MAGGDFSGVNFKEAQLSKVSPRGMSWFGREVHCSNNRCHPIAVCSPPPHTAPQVYAEGAKFDGADFTNGVIDRAFFKGASFKGAVFK